MRNITALLLFVSFGAPLAMAQARPTSLENSVPRYTVSLGYARVRSNAPPSGCDCFGTDGGYGTATFAVRDWVRIAGEVIGSHANRIGTLGQNLTLVTYTAGPQLVLHPGRVDIFGQALFGLAHGSDSYFPTGTTATTSANSFALSTGGGIDIGLTEHVAIRAAQVEYLRTTLPNAMNNEQNHLILAAGIVFRMHPVSWNRADKERAKAYKQMRDIETKAAAAPPAPMPANAPVIKPVVIAATSVPVATDNGADFDTSTRSAFFDYDSYLIRPDAKTSLEKDAAYLKAHPALQIVVAGYADERGTAEYNIALGEKRAQAARDQLIANGVSPDQLEVVSYGKEKQLCSTEDEKCFQENRRAGLELHR
jgi:peptidoglycan-associated lipoprotein